MKSINLSQRVYVPTRPEMPSSWHNKKIEKSINKASVEEQASLDCPKRAQNIIDHRESNCKFKSVDDLKKVSGIGAIEELKKRYV